MTNIYKVLKASAESVIDIDLPDLLQESFFECPLDIGFIKPHALLILEDIFKKKHTAVVQSILPGIDYETLMNIDFIGSINNERRQSTFVFIKEDDDCYLIPFSLFPKRYN